MRNGSGQSGHKLTLLTEGDASHREHTHSSIPNEGACDTGNLLPRAGNGLEVC